MNKKGFTLIELLAVIVILAIIALIATPIILNIIDDADKSSKERSVELYADSIKQAIARYQITNPTTKITELQISTAEAGKTYIGMNQEIIEVEYDGSVSCETIEAYQDGNIYLDNCMVNGEKIDYSYGTKSELSNDKYANGVYKDGSIIYYDVLKGNINCTDYHYDNSLTGYNGVVKSTQNQTSCLKFYVFLDNENSTALNLLLDHNTTDSLVWGYTLGNNVEQQLLQDTNNWNVIKSRLITLSELRSILKVNTDSNDIYIGVATWIYNNQGSYWISPSSCSSNGWRGEDCGISIVSNDGYIKHNYYQSVDGYLYDSYGIRPVIEISK